MENQYGLDFFQHYLLPEKRGSDIYSDTFSKKFDTIKESLRRDLLSYLYSYVIIRTCNVNRIMYTNINIYQDLNIILFDYYDDADPYNFHLELPLYNEKNYEIDDYISMYSHQKTIDMLCICLNPDNMSKLAIDITAYLDVEYSGSHKHYCCFNYHDSMSNINTSFDYKNMDNEDIDLLVQECNYYYNSDIKKTLSLSSNGEIIYYS